MKANVLYGIGDLLYTDVPEPELKPGEVLVRVCAAGICGSDVARVFKTGTYHSPPSSDMSLRARYAERRTSPVCRG